MAAEPLCRQVDNDVSTERHNRTPEPCLEGVIDLEDEDGWLPFTFKLPTSLQHMTSLWALQTTKGT
jgi:hypothetical protein